MQIRAVQSICQVEVEPQHDDRHYPRFDDHGKNQQRVKNEPASHSDLAGETRFTQTAETTRNSVLDQATVPQTPPLLGKSHEADEDFSKKVRAEEVFNLGSAAHGSHGALTYKTLKLAFPISETAAEKTRINGGLALVITAAVLRSASTAIHPAFRITSR